MYVLDLFSHKSPGAFICMFSEYTGIMGKVASAPKCSISGRKSAPVWLRMPPRPQVQHLSLLSFYPFKLDFISHVYDVRICLEPASVTPHEWPDDITKWPVSMILLVFLHQQPQLLSALHYFVLLYDVCLRYAPGTAQRITLTCHTLTVSSLADPAALVPKEGKNAQSPVTLWTRSLDAI